MTDPINLDHPILALTLWQPWASAIAVGPKRVENRVRRFRVPRGLRWFALHAGQRNDPDSKCWPLRLLWPDIPLAWEREVPHSAILAVARIRWAGLVMDAPPDERRAIDADIWATGPFVIRLARVVTLPEPVPCRGAQGWWRLPDAVERAVRDQVDAMSEPVSEAVQFVAQSTPRAEEVPDQVLDDDEMGF